MSEISVVDCDAAPVPIASAGLLGASPGQEKRGRGLRIEIPLAIVLIYILEIAREM
jgi:hypothetical protein